MADKLLKQVKGYVKYEKKFKWKAIVMTFIGPFLASLILFTIHFTMGQKRFPWINQFNLFVMVPAIMMSLFYSQKAELVGAYGETILLLIPTFVWLLPGHETAIWFMVVVAFVFMISSIFAFMMAWGTNKIFKKSTNKKGVIITSLITMRLGFIFIALASTLLVSISLVFWADYSMHFSSTNNVIDYTNPKWIAFVATVTIIVAAALVMLGLVSTFQKHFKAHTDKTVTQAITQVIPLKFKKNKKNVKFTDKTIVIPSDNKRKKGT